MNSLLEARGFDLNSNMTPLDDYYVWTKENKSEGKIYTVRVATSLFIGDKKLLQYINVKDWSIGYANIVVSDLNAADDLPF